MAPLPIGRKGRAEKKPLYLSPCRQVLRQNARFYRRLYLGTLGPIHYSTTRTISRRRLYLGKMDTIDYNKTRTIPDTLNSFKNTLIPQENVGGA